MITRRRFLAISAAFTAMPKTGSASAMYTWTGVALGARASIHLVHPDAKEIADSVAREINRLEDIFSLYRPNSEISRLNGRAEISTPSPELLECLSIVESGHAATDGLFDPTIQPLWARYAKASSAGESLDLEELDSIRANIGWSKVSIRENEILLLPGMALTLNGIAQGFIADKVAALLEGHGLSDILINTGEIKAIGSYPLGGDWPVKLTGGAQIGLNNRAIATSAPLASRFLPGSDYGHILDPRNGRSTPAYWKEITVSSPSAAIADLLSTSACLMNSESDIQFAIARFPHAKLEAAHEY